MKKTFKDIASLVLMMGLLAGVTQASFAAAAVTFKVVETPAVSVYTSQGTSDTTLVITPVPVDLDGNVLTMSNFGSNPTVTVDPGVAGIEEIESFTTITNNGNSTATLGGMTRDLQSVYPYTSTGAGRQHGGGAIVVFGNNPQVYGRLGALENDQLWTGINTYSAANKPTYNSTPTFGAGDGNAFVNYATLLATAIQGAGTSTEGTMGIVRLATFGQVGTGVASSSSGAPYVIENKFASSTYNGSTVFQGEIPTLRSTFNLDPNFIATSTGNNYVWGGNHTFTAGYIATASSTNTATTSIAASSVTNNALKLNGVPYAFPSTQGSTGSNLQNNGSGVLSWNIGTTHYNSINTTGIVLSGGALTVATSTAMSVPAGVLAASSTIMVQGNINTCQDNNSDQVTCTLALYDATTYTQIANCSFSSTASGGAVQGTLFFTITNKSSLSSQASISSCVVAGSTGATNQNGGTTLTSSLNTANALSLVMVASVNNQAGVNSLTLSNFSIVVTP